MCESFCAGAFIIWGDDFLNRGLKRLLAGVLMCLTLALAGLVPVKAATRFSDVPKNHWAADSIARAVELGLISGYKDSTFGLGKPMTRAAFSATLSRLFRWEAVQPAAGSFKDNQDTSKWYYSAVETARQNGAVTEQESAFRPHEPITREEMAVMLVRALGYAPIAGLVQELKLPFTDVTSNSGYLTMAYQLGIMSGKSNGTFEPNKSATREQAATVLVRIHDKLHSSAPQVCGIARSGESLTLTGVDTVAVPAAKVIYSGELKIVDDLSQEQVAAIRIKLSEKKQLMKVSGMNVSMKNPNVDAIASEIITEMNSAEWDGIFLDFEKLPGTQRAFYTELTSALKKKMGTGKLLYVTAEAPSWQGGHAYNGYDFAALSKIADRVILRVESYSKLASGFSAAPQEPLEEIYYALAKLHGVIPSEKLSLWLTTTGEAWKGTSAAGQLSATEIQKLLSTPGVTNYWSARYASPYLSHTEENTRVVVWYNDERAAKARRDLLNFLGGGGFCLSDLSGSLDQEGRLLDGLIR